MVRPIRNTLFLLQPLLSNASLSEFSITEPQVAAATKVSDQRSALSTLGDQGEKWFFLQRASRFFLILMADRSDCEGIRSGWRRWIVP